MLGAFYGEGGDVDVAAAFHGFADGAAEGFIVPAGGFVVASAIGAFHEHDVYIRHGDGVLQKFVVSSAYISGEEEAFMFAAIVLIFNIEYNLGGAEDVTGIVEGEGDAGGYGEGDFIADVNEAAEAQFCILFGVDDLSHIAVTSFAEAHFVEEFAVAFLDACGVCQHDLAEVSGGMGGIDEAFEAFFDEVGKVSRVVDMGVGEDDAIHAGGVEVGEVSVDAELVFPVTLVHAAVQEDFFAVDFQQVLGACSCFSCAAEVNFHHSLI